MTGGFPDHHILAIKPDGLGNVTKTHIAWRTNKGAAYVPSPIIEGDYFLVVSDSGVAHCWFAFLEQRGVFVVEIFQLHARIFWLMNRSMAKTCGESSATIRVKASPLASRAARAADAMDVILRMLRHVVVDDVAHVRDVQSARGDVRGDEHFEAAIAKTAQRLFAFALRAVGMQHGHGVIVALEQMRRRGRRRVWCGRK